MTDRPVTIRGNKRKVTWNGLEYESLSQAARANGVSKSTMFTRLARGHVCDSDLYRGAKPGRKHLRRRQLTPDERAMIEGRA